MKQHLRLAVALMLLCLTAPLQAQTRVPLTQNIAVSGTSQPFPNSNGAMQVSFEEKIAGSPSTILIVIQGCKLGNTCDTLDTYTTVANAIRPPSSSLTKVYDSFVVTASWTGGTNVVVTLNATLTTATGGNGNSGGAVSSVFTRTGDVVAAAGDYSLSQIGAGAAGGGTFDFTGVTLLKARLAAGLTTTVNGDFGFDTTNFNWHGWNGADGIFPLVPVGTAVGGQCPIWVVSSSKVSLGSAACGAGANTALSNLAAVSINTSLLAQTNVDLGGVSNPFRDLYLFGAGSYGSTYFHFTGTPTSTRIWTIQDATDTFVGRATTDTLTNKSIAGSEVNSGTVGATYGGTGADLHASAGIVRAGNPFTIAELSGDATTSGSNVVSVIKVNGAAVPVSKTIVGTNGSNQIIDASSATLANNTSGNAGTATALATTPSLCSTGNAPTGILANGNATGCASITSSFNPTITSPANTQTVSYNGSAWVNSYGGVSVDAQTTDYTFSCPTDRLGEIEFNISAAHGFYLPQAGSTACTQSSMAMVVRNTATSTASLTLCSGTGASGTCTPGTSTFQPEATSSINLIPGAAAFVYSDATSGTGNYHAIPIATPFGGINTQTANYTATLLDKDKLIVMNCTVACALTLPAAAPSSKWNIWAMSTGTTLATVSLNSLNFNGGASAPALIRYMPIMVRTDGSNYFGDTPLVAGSNITLAAGANGITIAASGGGGVGTLFVAGFQATTVTNGTITYAPVSGATSGGTTEFSFSGVIGAACTAQNAYVVTNATNGAGILSVTLRNGTTFSGMASTALVATVGSGAAAGTYSDTTHTVALTAGSIIDWQLSMSANTSGAIIGFGFQCK